MLRLGLHYCQAKWISREGCYGKIDCWEKLQEATEKLSYRKTSNISRTLVGNEIVDNSDVVRAAPVGAAPTTSSFST